MKVSTGFALLTGLVLGSSPFARAVSHPPLTIPPPVTGRPLEKGPARFVDAAKGDDAADGSEKTPWKSVSHALKQLTAGDTLCLRGGTYYENVYCAAAGRADAPVTIRSYPGEEAVIDGGIAEFFTAPDQAWVPVAGAAGEYRSAKPYGNLRDVIGSFGDSMIGLNTYFNAIDLRAQNEVMTGDKGTDTEKDCDPLYCGPGLWYDTATGFIHCRLAPTHLTGVANYAGESDPRKLPLILAPYRSVPLTVDRARFVRFQDLVIRGGGYDTVVLDGATDVAFDNVTVWAGTYGVRATGTGPLKVTRCGFYGNCPPWQARGDSSKRAYPGRPFRDITRLNTHSTWVIENGREFSVFATPVNDNWEIAFSDFADSHDGPYLGGVNLKFHHNLVRNTQDDGLYLSPMYPRHFYAQGGAEIHLYENVFSRCLTALAFGGTEDTKDTIFVYRNIFDMREKIFTSRPSAKQPAPGFSTGKIIGDHGSPPWAALNFYQNTFVCAEGGNYSMALLGGLSPERPRRVFNNILLNFGALHIPAVPKTAEAANPAGGNLYWMPGTDPEKGKALLAKNQPAASTHSLVADPLFLKADADPASPNDYRLQKGSPAIDAGVDLPAHWPDPRPAPDSGRPDIGALPAGAPPPKVGRF